MAFGHVPEAFLTRDPRISNDFVRCCFQQRIIFAHSCASNSRPKIACTSPSWIRSFFESLDWRLAPSGLWIRRSHTGIRRRRHSFVKRILRMFSPLPIHLIWLPLPVVSPRLTNLRSRRRELPFFYPSFESLGGDSLNGSGQGPGIGDLLTFFLPTSHVSYLHQALRIVGELERLSLGSGVITFNELFQIFLYLCSPSLCSSPVTYSAR